MGDERPDALKRRPEVPLPDVDDDRYEGAMETPSGIPLHEFFDELDRRQRRVKKSARRF